MGTTWGEMMVEQGENVLAARYDDAVRFNSDTLLELYRQLGNSSAESVICRAMEELAVRLVAIEQIPSSAEPTGLRKNARALAAIAEQRQAENVFVGEVRIQPNELLRPGMRGRAKIESAKRPLFWVLFHRAWDKIVFYLG